MAKRSTKQVIGYDKDHSGCVRGLINIFHFHHGRPSQKLLADKRHGSRDITGAAYTSNKLDRIDGSCEMCKMVKVGESCETATSDKMSVKELMDEEMFDRDQLRQMNTSEGDPKQAAAGHHGYGRKNRWHANKKSFDLSDVNVISEQPAHRKHKSLSSLDFGGMMAELCPHINMEDVDRLNHEKMSEETMLPSKDDPSVMEEKLAEATKVFVSHFIDGKNFMKDGKIQPSGEFMDALQILSSRKDVFLKLLQDPSSHLVKHIQRLEDHCADEDEKSKVQVGSALIEHEKSKNKHQSFLWKKFKGLDRSLSKKHEHSQNVSTIVVLKPGPASSQNSESTALQSSQDLGNKVQSERVSSYFFFNEFKRKLKHAMRKTQPSLGNSDKAVSGEGLFMASPTRDHFFIEKLPRKSISPKKWDKAGKVYEATTSASEQQISILDTEAKKHLTEIVGTGDVDVDFLSRQVPQSLGRILSYSDRSSSPICSPRKDEGHSLLTSPRKLSPGKGSESADEITPQQVQQEINHHPCSVISKSCTTTEKIGNDVEVKKSDVSGDCNPDGMDKCLHSAVDEIHCKGNIEIIRPADAELDMDKRISLDTSSESCSPSSRRTELAEEIPKDTKEEQTMCSNLDVVEEKEPSSPLISPTIYSRTWEVEVSDTVAERSDWTSPISVLEPIFKEDDVSPSIRSLPVVELIQPRHIEFEDHISSSTPRLKTWEEQRKSVFEFVKSMVRVSCLTRDQLLERFLFAVQLVDPSLFDEVDFLPDYCSYDPKLFFHLIDEVLMEICGHDFDGIPSFSKPYGRLELKGEDIVDEIWEGVNWHLKPQMMQLTLDQTVAKDVSKSLNWMDLRADSEGIGIEMEVEIFEELIEDTIVSCFSLVHGGEISGLPESGEGESSFEM